MPEFVLQLRDIDESGKDFVFAIRKDWMATALREAGLKPDGRQGDGEIKAYAQKTGEDVVIRGRAQAALVAECSRCLGDVHVAVRSEVTLFLRPRGHRFRPEPGERELTKEELQRDFYSGDKIVLDEVIREHLIVEVPMQPRCSDPDCVARWGDEDDARSRADGSETTEFSDGGG